ncbi:tripartite tricarboxylate transporter TctB family protein [Micromonospora globispora]|uniref:tripartite tricarboxylate transporter TctB family protein n=1 Tax=Micromonospora globispora TaxID=1450148 RepID=UPI000D7011E2|nr:tripartite tricarboxylate transporter TctB family protein [Micromonospora globispora]PWU59860.1 tripartite tricarboxylate transporter TctB family protein [Micromonospora globispora]RQW97743.1 tripartite tricarboxylate transporter TctB family protein [Micromonospora globispora]
MTAAHGGAPTQGSPGGQPVAGPPSGTVLSSGPDGPATPLEELSLEEAIHRVEEAEHEGRPPAAGPLSNVLTAAAVVALGIAALVGSTRLGLGTVRSPESGTWPLLVSAALVALGLGLLAAARRTTDAERFSGASWLVLAGLATMVVFVAVIQIIGFEIPATLLTFVWLRFLGREGWRTSIVTSLAVVVAFYLIFVAALSVPIPHLF